MSKLSNILITSFLSCPHTVSIMIGFSIQESEVGHGDKASFGSEDFHHPLPPPKLVGKNWALLGIL